MQSTDMLDLIQSTDMLDLETLTSLWMQYAGVREERSMGMVMKEVDGDLALLRRYENQKNDLLIRNPNVLNDPSGSKRDHSFVTRATSSDPGHNILRIK
ncbi:unnamed protein product [Ilex paraguariensis]|uniref:Uncharacterized protein n=1 Tax=Ilex paraguariensis TaxID=185542 RepID=A0ABC8TP33_9AQUA